MHLEVRCTEETVYQSPLNTCSKPHAKSCKCIALMSAKRKQSGSISTSPTSCHKQETRAIKKRRQLQMTHLSCKLSTRLSKDLMTLTSPSSSSLVRHLPIPNLRDKKAKQCKVRRSKRAHSKMKGIILAPSWRIYRTQKG